MINPMNLMYKNILVTGASSGIGRATAILLSRLGARVILLARNELNLSVTLDLMEKGQHNIIPLDLRETNKIEFKLLDFLQSKDIKLNGLVHAAGIQIIKPIHMIMNKEFEEIITVNYLAFQELVRLFSKRKINENGGSIVAISSISSIVGSKGYSLYCASKGALESSIKAFAVELAAKKIRVNAVRPSWVDTEMYKNMLKMTDESFVHNINSRQSLGIIQPEDIAYSVAFLLCDASKYITGTSLTIDGGYTAQ